MKVFDGDHDSFGQRSWQCDSFGRLCDSIVDSRQRFERFDGTLIVNNHVNGCDFGHWYFALKNVKLLTENKVSYRKII